MSVPVTVSFVIVLEIMLAFCNEAVPVVERLVRVRVLAVAVFQVKAFSTVGPETYKLVLVVLVPVALVQERPVEPKVAAVMVPVAIMLPMFRFEPVELPKTSGPVPTVPLPSMVKRWLTPLVIAKYWEAVLFGSVTIDHSLAVVVPPKIKAAL